MLELITWNTWYICCTQYLFFSYLSKKNNNEDGISIQLYGGKVSVTQGRHMPPLNFTKFSKIIFLTLCFVFYVFVPPLNFSFVPLILKNLTLILKSFLTSTQISILCNELAFKYLSHYRHPFELGILCFISEASTKENKLRI